MLSMAKRILDIRKLNLSAKPGFEPERINKSIIYIICIHFQLINHYEYVIYAYLIYFEGLHVDIWHIT